MNYSKLELSFICLFIMTLIQLLVSLFIVHHLILIILSFIAMLLCGLGLWYVNKRKRE
ncbi:MAG: hypothetical protein ACRCTE_14680 [Cellulosilyticaceae bacterium]